MHSTNGCGAVPDCTMSASDMNTLDRMPPTIDPDRDWDLETRTLVVETAPPVFAMISRPASPECWFRPVACPAC